MLRGKLIALGVVGLALLAPAGASAGPAKEVAGAAFRLQGSHGYSILVLAFGAVTEVRGEVLVLVERPGENAFYTAPATVTTTSVEADLGALGEISLELEPTGVRETARSHCSKKPVHYEGGAYVGEASFDGEHGYTRARATRVKALAQPFLDLVCPGYGFATSNGPGLPGAELDVRSRSAGAGPHLSVYSNGPGKPVKLGAELTERVGHVTVRRNVSKLFPASTFTYDSDLRTAALQPPAPFSGRALFDRATRPSERWSGNLSVDFPGRTNVPLAGPKFQAALRHVHWSEETLSPIARPAF